MEPTDKHADSGDQVTDRLDAREARWFEPGLGEHLVSQAQRQANRRNAARSTGPKSAEGKAASSRNALRNGLYSSSASAIPHGALRENADDVQDFLEMRVDALQPRDAMEYSVASEIARSLLKLARIDAYTSLQLSSDGKTDPMLAKLGLQVPDERVERYLATSFESLAEFLRPGARRLDRHADFEGWAKLIRGHKKKVLIRDLWTEEITPKTHAEWKRAFRVLLRECFSNEQEAGTWALTKTAESYQRLETAKGSRFEGAAARAINTTLESTSRHRGRALAELDRLMKMYVILQARELSETDRSGDGTKPISQSRESEN